MTIPSIILRRGATVTTVAAFALSGLVALGAAPANAAFDSSCTPATPALKTLKIKPGKVNVKKRQRVVTISGTTTGPALQTVTVFGEPNGKGPDRFGYAAKPKANSFSVKVKVPKGAAKGRHHITLSLSSRTGTHNMYSKDQLAALGLPSSFNVASKPDRKAPTIKRIAIPTKRVNTTKKAAKVKVNARLADKGGSGLDYAWVLISNGQRETSAVLRKRKGQWTGTATFPKWAGKKKATVIGATVYDKAGNYTTYGQGVTAKKLRKPLKAGFNVKSKRDTKNPRVTSATASPSTFKVGDRRHQVKYTVKAKDGQSGVASVDVSLVRTDSAYSYGVAHGYLKQRKGSWTGNGVIECYLQPGTYVVEVEVTDKVGRKTTTRQGTVTLN